MNNRNIIMISIDCLRADCIGVFPNKILLKKYDLNYSDLKTPTLDNLAGQGTFFTNCFTASTYTTSSHGSILTGYYPINSGVQEYFKNKIAKKTIFKLVKKDCKDYFTLFCTDFPFILGKHLGFDRKVDYYCAADEKKSIEMLRKIKDNKNFLAFFHFSNVHTPYGFTGLKEDGDKFINEVNYLKKAYKIISKNGDEESEWLENERSKKEVRLREIYHLAVEKMYSDKNYSGLMEMYIRGVSYFDGQRLKDFIKLLKKEGLFNDSVIFIFSDHGERWWDDSHGHHDNLYDETIRVPLIVIGDGFPKNKIIDTQIRTIDIVPTIVELLNLSDKDSFDGTSLIPLDKIKPTIAIGEIWTCEDVNNIKKLMYITKRKNKLLQSDKYICEGFLWKEYIRTEKYKVVNKYHDKNKTTETFKIVNGQEILSRIDQAELSVMKKGLLSYRKNKLIKGRVVPMSDSINNLKKNLKLLGYNV